MDNSITESHLSQNHQDLISRLDSWTLQLYAIQHFDEAIKSFSGEVFEGLQAHGIIFFKYLKSFSSMVATHSEGINFSEVRGQGLNFSNDKKFSPVRDFLRIQQNNSFIEIMNKVAPDHNFTTSLCVVRGEVKGLFVFTDIEPQKLETSYYKVAERLFSHWLSEIFLLDLNHNLTRNDELTGLLNKRVFSEYVALEVGRAQRIKHPVSFMVIRLDGATNLKSELNIDRYHSMLKMVGKILAQSTRKSDYLGQLSETEFGVLLPHMSIKNAKNKAKQIKNILEAAKYFNEMNLNFQLHFSVGYSEYPSCAYDFEDLQLSTIQKLMIEAQTSQIVEVTKGSNFIPDFLYENIETTK